MNAFCSVLVLLGLIGLASSQESGVVRGRVLIPANVNHSTTTIILHTSTGEEMRTYVNGEGAFAFHDVPSGVHLLQPFNLHLVYPEVRLEVNRKGVVSRAALSHNRNMVLNIPLSLRPAMEAAYYEKRKPFDAWSFIKSPYGLMIAFSLFAIVVFPRLKMDPEEYKEMQAVMGTGGAAAAGGAGAVGGGQQAPRLRQ
ncbi:hypothetical protein HYH02_009708 [Chlamydomonas schloesseri]|uniref:ER membrane protein complex subunit 7 beta-sandwich domain-containing protein n=1 Tax=Chlamydomonas schloesseri TaxID=2026947 RepID=A0A835TB84_9CHLO|nr:hypothetical protein HYH02_009708 [Chlamydomonas schloesseri]|eukprot:KAG2442224.1 hypothetical protein HYH02_009708 [Chlamydomonas schloesseri]